MASPYKHSSSSLLPRNPRERALQWLGAHSSPRLLMSLMLAISIGCGFLSSIFLHSAGVASPLLRYPISVAVGWGVFLIFVSVWVWHLRRAQARAVAFRQAQRRGSSSIDVSGWANGGGSQSANPSSWSGGGGSFGGGGASDSFADVSGDGASASFMDGREIPLDGRGSSSGLSVDFEFGDDGIGAVILLIAALAVAAAVFGVAFYAVYSAPTFFAELLIDGGVGTWLYKRADVANRPDWLTTAVRRSVWPVVILLVVFIALAMVMHSVAPAATTVGEAWRMVGNK